MLIISHRGNIEYPKPKLENKLSYIDTALNLGYNVELDIFYDNGFWLGHDKPMYKTAYRWLVNRSNFLWIHCKNLEALQKVKNSNILNYFWHETDSYTLTSNGYIWTFPNKKVPIGGICVLPDDPTNPNKTYDSSNWGGVCSDYIKNWK